MEHFLNDISSFSPLEQAAVEEFRQRLEYLSVLAKNVLFLGLAVAHVVMHKAWYRSLFRTGRGQKSPVTIVLSVVFLLLVGTGVGLLFVEGANSGIGLWHWGIGLAVTVLSIGHIAKRWRTLRKGMKDTNNGH